MILASQGDGGSNKINWGFHNMANKLTELTPHINEMRTKLSQTAEHERSLT